MLHLRRFEDIAEADLEALIQEKIREGTQIDYKRAINLQTDGAKAELVRDVSSFANAAGGHMVIGMDETSGLPKGITGLPASTDFERLEQQILQTCRAHINPPITTMRMRAILLKSGANAFVIRIDKTWNGPHMVTMDKENRCWTRDHSGKRPMDVPDLRQAIAFSEGAASRMKQFRMERVGNIIAGETPIPLSSGQCIIVHFMPLVSFTGAPPIDLHIETTFMPPLNHNMGYGPMFTFEGKMTYSALTNGPNFTYCLLFRNGMVEFADSLSLSPASDGNLKGIKLFYVRHFQSAIDAIETAIKLYKKLGVSTPIFGTISLTNVKDYRVFVPLQYSGISGKPLNRDTLMLPEFIIENYETPTEQLLKETFTTWWQACGYGEMQTWFKQLLKFPENKTDDR